MKKSVKTGLVVLGWVGLVILARSGMVEERFDRGQPALFVLASVSCAFFPLPTNVFVLLVSKSADPTAVASVAALATPIAFALEYQIYTLIVRRGKMLNITKVKVLPRLFAGYSSQPFFVLAVASFLPMPTEPLRLYAIASRYSRWRYAMAGFVGRLPRYLLIAWLGRRFGSPTWLILAILLLPTALLLSKYAFTKGYAEISKALKKATRKQAASGLHLGA